MKIQEVIGLNEGNCRKHRVRGERKKRRGEERRREEERGVEIVNKMGRVTQRGRN
jgi:hypothetical protein